MKLGLLVLLAVAVLLPSFSESWTVSKCELRDKLGEGLKLPRRLEKYRDAIVRRVVCELEKRSNLNTELIKVYGKRTTPEPQVVETPSTTRVNEMTTEEPTIETTNSKLVTSPTTTARARTTAILTETPLESTTANARSTTILPETTLESVTTAGSKRRKREADSNSNEMSIAELLEQEENMFDEEEMERDDNHIMDDNRESSEVVKMAEETSVKRKRRSALLKKPKRESSQEGENSSEENAEAEHTVIKPWSLGLYGLFQLSDSHFCYSGYRWSRNVCGTNCTAFTDDDITDDIDCFLKTRYFWFVFRDVSHSCRHQKNYFQECN